MQEPERKFMEMVAENLGVNKLWMSKGTNVPIFDTGEIEYDLDNILETASSAEDIFFAIAKEGYGNCISVILKFNDVKYIGYKNSFVFHAEGGASGQHQLMQIYDFLQKVSGVKNSKGRYLSLDNVYLLSEEEWVELKKGNMYPGAIRKFANSNTYMLEDFLDIRNRYKTKEQYTSWYGESFVKCQELVKYKLDYSK